MTVEKIPPPWPTWLFGCALWSTCYLYIPENTTSNRRLPETSPSSHKSYGRAGVNVTVRRSRGLDISAACGQLQAEKEIAS